MRSRAARGDHRAHLDVRRVAGADGDSPRLRGELAHQGVAGIADGDDRGHRHAALACGPVRGADDRARGLTQVGVGQHDGVILGSAQRLHALAVPRAGLVDVFRDRRRADERDRANRRMREDRVDGFLVAVHDVEHALGQSRLGEQLGHAQREAGIALGRLQDERVAAGERDGEHPQRHHRGEIERRDAGAHADRLPQRPAVDVAAHVVAELTLDEMRDAGRELDDLDAARDGAGGVGERLAVLLGDHAREILLVRLEELAKPHQDAGAAQRGPRAPLRERRRGGACRGVDVVGVRKRHVTDHLAGRRVGDVAVARRSCGDGSPADPERQLFACSGFHDVLRAPQLPVPAPASASARRAT